MLGALVLTIPGGFSVEAEAEPSCPDARGGAFDVSASTVSGELVLDREWSSLGAGSPDAGPVTVSSSVACSPGL